MQRRKGTIQYQRENRQLLDPTFQIDERSFEDLLAYVVSYVEKINFYTTENVIDGNWKVLLEQDPIIYIVGIIKKPTDNLRAENETPSVIITTLLEWYDTIKQWYHTLVHFNESLLADKISNVLFDVLQEKKEILSAIQETTDEKEASETPLYGFSSGNINVITYKEVDLEEMIHTFRKMVLYIQNFTSSYLKTHIFSRKNHLPNNAMYIAFSILFNKVQKLINDIAKKHLNFYYQEVLQQTPSKGISTKAVVCFELTPKSIGVVIPEKMPLIAGKLFESKKNILFETVKPLLAVPVEIDKIQNFYLNKSPFIKIGTKQPTISNILQNTLVAKGKIQSVENKALFGANESTLIDSEVTEEKVTDIGFMLGSQVLFLEEGEREITLTFTLEKETSEAIFWKLLGEMSSNQGLPLDVIFNDVFEEAFIVSYTTKKAWVTLSSYHVQFDPTENTLRLTLHLDNTLPPLTISAVEKAYSWPMLKVVLSEYAPIYAYSFLKGVQLEKVNIDVRVSEMKNVAAYNNTGKLSLTKPFHLFGATPELGGYLLIGKSELFQKELSEVTLRVTWDNIPTDDGGFDTYYKEYSKEITNDSFLVSVSALSNGYWLPREEKERDQMTLFETRPAFTAEGYKTERLTKQTSFVLDQLDKYQLARNYKLKDPIPYTINAKSGFLRFDFIAPSIGFGKELYKKDYTDIATYNAKNEESLPLPNPPYVPKVKELGLSYTANDVIYFNNAFDDTASTVKGDFIHITPFGLERTVEDSKVYKDTLVYNFEGEGYLYVKLTNVQSETNISLFFDVNNSTPAYFEEENNIIIEYKNMDNWIPMAKKNIISDSTNQLSKAGIIELLIPLMSEELGIFELRFVAKKEAYKYPILNGIFPNAVEATCTSEEENVIGQKVVAGSIAKAGKKIPDIKKIWQPQASYGGKVPTSPTLFYTEVSERLRHKDRALTIWDYEHLILQQFHDLVAVKCTNLTESFQPKSGNVTIILLSNQWKHDNHHYLNTNELGIIKQFIKRKSNPFIKIKVQNPIVEWLLVTCIVDFNKNNHGGYYIKELNQELNTYLCPVTQKESVTVEGIGCTVVPRMLKSHLENLPYVQSIKKLEIEHIVKEGLDDYSLNIYEESKEIKPTKPWSMLAPKLKHNIFTASILEEETIEEIESQNFRIGVDYIIAGDGEDLQDDFQITDVLEEDKHIEKVSTKPSIETDKTNIRPNTILNFRIE